MLSILFFRVRREGGTPLLLARGLFLLLPFPADRTRFGRGHRTLVSVRSRNDSAMPVGGFAKNPPVFSGKHMPEVGRPFEAPTRFPDSADDRDIDIVIVGESSTGSSFQCMGLDRANHRLATSRHPPPSTDPSQSPPSGRHSGAPAVEADLSGSASRCDGDLLRTRRIRAPGGDSRHLVLFRRRIADDMEYPGGAGGGDLSPLRADPTVGRQVPDRHPTATQRQAGSGGRTRIYIHRIHHASARLPAATWRRSSPTRNGSAPCRF